MHANTLRGIFEISKTYLPLISKTISEPIRHLFAFLIPFKEQGSKMTSLTSFSKSEKKAKIFLNSILKCYLWDQLFFPRKISVASCCIKRMYHMSTMNHALLVLMPDCLCTRTERDNLRMTLYAQVLTDLLCEAWCSGMTRWVVKKHYNKLVTSVSLLQGSVHHPPLAQFSGDSF